MELCLLHHSAVESHILKKRIIRAFGAEVRSIDHGVARELGPIQRHILQLALLAEDTACNLHVIQVAFRKITESKAAIPERKFG